jgi:hypothetical protein
MLMPSADSVEEVKALRQRLIDRGYEPVAVATGEKRPVELGWQHKPPSASAHVGALNTGLRCGAIIAVDIDIDDAKELDQAVGAVEAVALPTPLIRERASAPRLILVYRADEEMKKRILPFGSGKIEFLATGQQFVSHGTHPCGDTFLWRDMAPEEIDASELPVLTSAHIDEIARRLGVETEPPVPPAPTAPTTSTTAHDGAGDREHAWARAALDKLASEISATPEGSRSDALNKGAYRLGGMVARDWLAHAEAEQALRAAVAGWAEQKKTINTIRRGLREGQKTPHPDLPDDAADLIARERRNRLAEELDAATSAAAVAISRPPVPLLDPWQAVVVPPFPVDTLSDALAEFVERNAAHLGADPAALAMAALTACSGALDHRWKLRMQKHGDWTTAPRLWTLLVGDPSVRKTPVMNVAMAPLERREGMARNAYLTAKGQCTSKEEVEALDPPPRYVVADITVEKLGDVLSRQPQGVLVKRDELSGWIGSMERYSSNNSSDRALWLQAFNGGPFLVDRIKRGEVYVPNLSVTLIGGIQPARVNDLGNLTSDGLLQRFIPVMMGPARLPDDRPFDRARNTYGYVVDCMIDLVRPVEIGGDLPLTLSPAAAEVFADLQAHLFHLEQASAGLAAGLQGFIGKLNSVFGALAIILHFADEVTTKSLEISGGVAERASRIVRDFILPHAKEFYRSTEAATDGDKLQRLASWILTSGKTRFVASDFTANVAHLRGLSLFDLNRKISVLVAGGWLQPAEAGPLPKAWTLTPSVPAYFAARAAEEDARKVALADLMGATRRGPKS